MSKSEQEQEFITVSANINWIVPESLVSRYASNVTVQVLDTEFRVSFFEVKPEIIIGQKLKDLKDVDAYCVADIFMNPAKIPSLIKALESQYEVYKNKLASTLKNIQEES